MRQYVYDVIHKDSGTSIVSNYVSYKEAHRIIVEKASFQNDYLIVPVLDDEWYD